MSKAFRYALAIGLLFIAGCVNGESRSLEQEQPLISSNTTTQIDEQQEAKEQAKLLEMATKAESVTVLVNRQFPLPDGFYPEDLVYPDVPFLFEEKIEKRMLRKEAAEALEKLFVAAEADGLRLIGVSAYRSHRTQTGLYNLYVEKDGEEAAKIYSALPGTSEHETGLAIDVTGGDGSCAAESCFADTEEAKWLEEHAAHYGYIIRYPEGKEVITGYMYEPWHIRYVGVDLAKEMTEQGLTLEEYYQVIPVTNE